MTYQAQCTSTYTHVLLRVDMGFMRIVSILNVVVRTCFNPSFVGSYKFSVNLF